MSATTSHVSIPFQTAGAASYLGTIGAIHGNGKEAGARG